jgi:Fe-S-cluster formation regulator IscX/YfhJ
MNYASKGELLFFKKRELDYQKMKNLNKKNNELKKGIYKKKIKEINPLTKYQENYINDIKKKNNITKEIKNIIQPEFINISSQIPENKFLIKTDLTNIYDEGDIMNKNLLDLEKNKIDEEFRKNFLTLMSLRDYDTINADILNEYKNRTSFFKKYINTNFIDLTKKLKEKYISLDITQLFQYLKEYYKDKDGQIIRDIISKSNKEILKKINDKKDKLKDKILYQEKLKKEYDDKLIQIQKEQQQKIIDDNKRKQLELKQKRLQIARDELSKKLLKSKSQIAIISNLEEKVEKKDDKGEQVPQQLIDDINNIEVSTVISEQPNIEDIELNKSNKPKYADFLNFLNHLKDLNENMFYDRKKYSEDINKINSLNINNENDYNNNENIINNIIKSLIDNYNQQQKEEQKEPEQQMIEKKEEQKEEPIQQKEKPFGDLTKEETDKYIVNFIAGLEQNTFYIDENTKKKLYEILKDPQYLNYLTDNKKKITKLNDTLKDHNEDNENIINLIKNNIVSEVNSINAINENKKKNKKKK